MGRHSKRLDFDSARSDEVCINLLVIFGVFMECVELRLVEGIHIFFVRRNDDVVG